MKYRYNIVSRILNRACKDFQMDISMSQIENYVNEYILIKLITNQLMRSDNKLLKVPILKIEEMIFAVINGNINKYYSNTGINLLIK